MDLHVLGHFRKLITSTIQEKYQHNSFHNTEDRIRPFILRFEQKNSIQEILIQTSNPQHTHHQPSLIND